MKNFIVMTAILATPMNAFAQIGYQNAQYFHSSGAAPVIVPPTIINTQQASPNESKKSCRESMIDLFLFSVRRTTGDCTP
jgi:hypothetical protein